MDKMEHPGSLNIEDFDYSLPDHKIASHPAVQRQDSKLLVFQKGDIKKDAFNNIPAYIEPGSLLVFNNTRVIRARILFQKTTGATIEIFCLEPLEAEKGYQESLISTGTAFWNCFIGGAQKWKEPFIEKVIEISGTQVILKAIRGNQMNGTYPVTFHWDPAQFTFLEVLEHAGSVPLPPYIKRKPIATDKERYQAIFAKHEGSVAAPTASLHFTDDIFTALESKGILRDFVTLHVGAGTFKPVSTTLLQQHEMHAEWIEIKKSVVEVLAGNNQVIAVGTTSLRTIETAYWLGVKIIMGDNNLELDQWDVYQSNFASANIPATTALLALQKHMTEKKMDHVFTKTRILIAPGYKFRIAKGLITNFHQPKSTLLLLIAAAVGNSWKDIYSFALENDFRFLSYGDGSLLYFDQG